MRRINVKYYNESIGFVECEFPCTWSDVRKALRKSEIKQQHYAFLDTRRDDVSIPIAPSDEASECLEDLTEIHIKEVPSSACEQREYEQSNRQFVYNRLIEETGDEWVVLDENSECVGSFCCVRSTTLDIVRVLIKSRCYIGKGTQWCFVMSSVEIPFELEVQHQIQELTPWGRVNIRTKSIHLGENKRIGLQCVKLTCGVM